MVKPQRLLLAMIFCLCGASGLQAQFYWSGLSNSSLVTNAANWRGQTAPPNNGTADLVLDHAVNEKVALSGAFNLHTITLSNGAMYVVSATAPTTLTIGSGIAFTDDIAGQLAFGSNVSISLNGGQTWDAYASQITVSGLITGSGPLTLVASSTTTNGFFIFNNTSSNTYTGGTTLGDGTHFAGVAFWNTAPFGTGTVNVLAATGNVVQLIAHGSQTLANAFTFSGGGALNVRSWDDKLVFSGTFTLASNAIFQSAFNQNAVTAPNQAGSIPLPGMYIRNPIVYSGGIGETGGSRSLTIGGVGVTVISGTNTYTGGTSVNGSAVFSGASAAPATGTIVVNSQGYLGFGDTSSGAFASFLASKVNTATSVGAIGIDTLPGNSTVTLSDAINLTGYNTALRLGTATTAILNGAITPQAASGYQFGNGGGTLYVTSNLSLAKALSLSSTNAAIPLTLYLQGSNSYTGATSVANGFLVLDSSGALSSNTPTITASGGSTAVGASYIGITDASGLSTATFLSKFDKTNTWGIVGFDTHQGNSTVNINGVDLTGFNNGVFIGTTTSAIISGTLTASTVTNANNAANTLRFTAGLNGVLTVNSAIGGATAVMIGSPVSTGPYNTGTVILNGANTYAGGTTLNATSVYGASLAVGNNNALGTGTLTVTSVSGGMAGLSASAAGLNLANAITLVNQTGPGTNGPQLYLTGSNAFTLSGNITGDATTEIDIFGSTPPSVTLSGNNSSFLGNISIAVGTLNLQSNNAAGLGTIYYSPSATATVAFGGGATAPTLYGIYGDSGILDVATGTNLTFDVSDDVNHETEFGGVVSGNGSLTISAPSAVSKNALYLYGNNTYTGGTTILNNAYLALGANTSAGTGAVTLNAPSGGLLVNSGATFTNPLTFTSGTLGGFGTFAPAGTSSITFDTGRAVAPGVGGLAEAGSVGKLTLNTDVTFANGGKFVWGLQDGSRSDGYSLLAISGNLLISASAGGFSFKIETYDLTNSLGLASITLGTPYSLPVLTTTGTITGFNASAFTIDSTSFQNGTMAGTVFSLSQSGNTIYLNFTPVPEPSTYALLGLGLGGFALALRRRRLAR